MEYRQEELIEIVTELCGKYTSYESSSVSYETACLLMEGVLYCLNEYHHSSSTAPENLRLSVKERYLAGKELVFQKACKIRDEYHLLPSYFDDYGVENLHDTVIKGIPEFLKWYDVRFFPQKTILTLDYPILTDLHQLCGADAVYTYLMGIRAEQLFLNLFEKQYIQSALEAAVPVPRLMMDNIGEIVLTDVTKRWMSRKNLHPKNIEDLEGIILSLTEKLSEHVPEDALNISLYLKPAVRNIAVRLYKYPKAHIAPIDTKGYNA